MGFSIFYMSLHELTHSTNDENGFRVVRASCEWSEV
ncbi:MAG: hypothetical protein JWN25_2241, partial [Verrucomicrobiales bacterium]|nr:hypothetical protein [Verrucomicrobiales bacterium]